MKTKQPRRAAQSNEPPRSVPRPDPLALAITNILRAGGASLLLSVTGEHAALAAPEGGTVVAGQASIQHPSSTRTDIVQHSDRAAIDWQRFNIGTNEHVNFQQPNATSAILNRVISNDPSAILGHLTANGQVYLVNPNGILFGKDALVNVGSLIASTANISNQDFMAGRMNFTEPGKPGATVRNEGRITVREGGFAALVGPGVENAGVIEARLGKVTLAAGDAFTLDLYGDELINLIVDREALHTMTDAQGKPLAHYVNQSGEIVAEGGRVHLLADTVKGLVDNLINMSGTVRATSFENREGTIVLRGGEDTVVKVAGTLDTSGRNAGERGGVIQVTGREVDLAATAKLDASGSAGGGNIAVGGEWQGKGTLANAKETRIAEGALLTANAIDQGKGGTVVAWSDHSTEFSGRIEAKGGAQGGDGGAVEVSGKEQLKFRGEVDAGAPKGQAGSLLLDPRNLTVGKTASTAGDDVTVAADTVSDTLSTGTKITLQASNDLTVDSVIDGRLNDTKGNPIGTAGGGLTLTAGNNANINNHILLNNGELNVTAERGKVTAKEGTVLYTGTQDIKLTGKTGVTASYLVTSGNVSLTSASGGITVTQPITAETSANPIKKLTMAAAGDVTLSGARVGGGGVNVQSGTFKLNRALIVAGDVKVSSRGAITVDEAIDTRPAPKKDVTLTASSGNLTVNKAIYSDGGTIRLEASAGSLVQKAPSADSVKNKTPDTQINAKLIFYSAREIVVYFHSLTRALFVRGTTKLCCA